MDYKTVNVIRAELKDGLWSVIKKMFVILELSSPNSLNIFRYNLAISAKQMVLNMFTIIS